MGRVKGWRELIVDTVTTGLCTMSTSLCLSWDNDTLHLLTKFLHSIFVETYSACLKGAKSLEGPNTGDVWLWAGNLTALCLSFLFCKMETFQMVLVKTQWAHTCEMTGLWPVHSSCSVHVRSGAWGGTGGHSTVGWCAPCCILCRPGLTGLHRSIKIPEF